MKYLLTRRLPEVSRILLAESGSRLILEGIILGLRQTYGQNMFIDVVTCYQGLPEGLRPETTNVYRVGDYVGRSGRARLYAELKRNRYSILGIICSSEPIMTKWKWSLAARLPAKVFILNENGDYLWLDYGHWAAIRHFVLFRAGLAGAGAVRTLARLALFPFTLLFLLGYAAIAHLTRRQVKVGE